MTKVCNVVALVLLVFAALGPAKWVPRSGLGWQIDHFVGYFGFTLMFCLAWPRPLVVGGTIMALAVLLEGLQAFTPDRSFYLPAVVYGAGGALAAVLPADLFIRARILTWEETNTLIACGCQKTIGSGFRLGRVLINRAQPCPLSSKPDIEPASPDDRM